MKCLFKLKPEVVFFWSELTNEKLSGKQKTDPIWQKLWIRMRIIKVPEYEKNAQVILPKDSWWLIPSWSKRWTKDWVDSAKAPNRPGIEVRRWKNCEQGSESAKTKRSWLCIFRVLKKLLRLVNGSEPENKRSWHFQSFR